MTTIYSMAYEIKGQQKEQYQSGIKLGLSWEQVGTKMGLSWDEGHLPDELTVETIKQFHHSFPQNPTIADVLFKTTFLENWGCGVDRMVDACREVSLPKPEFNQNAAFVWVTFKRTTIQPHNPITSQHQRVIVRCKS